MIAPHECLGIANNNKKKKIILCIYINNSTLNTFIRNTNVNGFNLEFLFIIRNLGRVPKFLKVNELYY